LFYFCGVLIGRARRNWFIGIRTPWTLSSDVVWDKTHRRGAKLFMISGIIAVFGMFFKGYTFIFVLAPVLLFSIYLVFYSYAEYKKTK